jgi:hypothetical protein
VQARNPDVLVLPNAPDVAVEPGAAAPVEAAFCSNAYGKSTTRLSIIKAAIKHQRLARVRILSSTGYAHAQRFKKEGNAFVEHRRHSQLTGSSSPPVPPCRKAGSSTLHSATDGFRGPSNRCVQRFPRSVMSMIFNTRPASRPV